MNKLIYYSHVLIQWNHCWNTNLACIQVAARLYARVSRTYLAKLILFQSPHFFYWHCIHKHQITQKFFSSFEASDSRRCFRLSLDRLLDLDFRHEQEYYKGKKQKKSSKRSNHFFGKKFGFICKSDLSRYIRTQNRL